MKMGRELNQSSASVIVGLGCLKLCRSILAQRHGDFAAFAHQGESYDNVAIQLNSHQPCFLPYFWNDVCNTSIRDAVKKYILDNGIDNDLVFYSLSPSNYKQALKPDVAWHDLWKIVPGGRSVNSKRSAKFLVEEFLPNL